MWYMGSLEYHLRLITMLCFLIILVNRIFKVFWKITHCKCLKYKNKLKRI